VIFEGRDAAGKGGVIKRIAERTNPRGEDVVGALARRRPLIGTRIRSSLRFSTSALVNEVVASVPAQ